MKRNSLIMLFFVAACLVIDVDTSEAQLFRGRFRSASAAGSAPHSAVQFMRPSTMSQQFTQPESRATVFPRESYYADQRHPMISRVLDGPMTHRYRDPVEVDSRYTGGFHQSHFQNLGLPSGDIGLRGNALNWRTW